MILYYSIPHNKKEESGRKKGEGGERSCNPKKLLFLVRREKRGGTEGHSDLAAD